MSTYDPLRKGWWVTDGIGRPLHERAAESKDAAFGIARRLAGAAFVVHVSADGTVADVKIPARQAHERDT